LTAKRKTRRTTELTLQLERSALSEMVEGGAPKEASFVVLGGLDVGNAIPVRRDRATILGRDPSCDGILRDDGISRRHAQVVCSGTERFVLIDMGSTNGIFVEGRRVERHVLEEGDKILVGRRTILKFVMQDSLEARFQRQMYESAVRDALTGAFNRKHFDERISSEVSFARRHVVSLSLVMMDLDHFKRINDTWGHQAGDQVLVAVAGAAMETLREEDVFARYGGEEFAVIARGISEAGGLSLGERLRAEIEAIVVTAPGGERIPVTVSAGVATIGGGEEVEVAALVACADSNLYKAKAAGRNRVVASRLSAG
jgi:diguanylate cyclase (GGDEF)-like protein